ncbi:FAD-dependent oxidoreductase domain-containing protein 2 [Trichoplax sp. H2]|nr:FAD-dependent oxidoreductase domain-containing protein 2 [Trichoplax sp. H2]|eukprot:RDD41256.1 FAD-dependent oxidoreductase domain-containing protein 2 [Trichoplax sp. H2]
MFIERNRLFYFLVLLLSAIGIHAKCIHYQYCIIGAGPGGLQMAYYFQRAGRDYVVFERNNISGSFFTHYPRHRRLLSINKKHTGAKNAEFNLRHDWNTLLSHKSNLTMTRYSDDIYPHADDLVKYLNDYANELKLMIRYNKNITRITRVHSKKSIIFKLVDQNMECYVCDRLIISTGLATPYIPKYVPGMEYIDGYESISTNASEFIGQNILILGQGNSGFETAQSLSSVSNFLHVLGGSNVRLATSTHYIGDVRGINSKILDSYQLKTLDGLLEERISAIGFVKREDNKLHLCFKDDNSGNLTESKSDLRYDRIIRCLGFRYDKSIFSENSRPLSGRGKLWKYPEITESYESTSTPNMFFAGALAHSLDYRISGGCCIQGFRYTARALHHLLEWRYHKVPWPAKLLTPSTLYDELITRINQASGLYQMFSTLADVILIAFVLVMISYSTDTLSTENYRHTAETAHHSKNIHPVLRYYRKSTLKKLLEKNEMPVPDRIHHVLEDFLTDWSVYSHHGHYLKLFLEKIFKLDLDNYYAGNCFAFAMSFKKMPITCSKPTIQKIESMITKK